MQSPVNLANWGPAALPGHFGDPVALNFQVRRTGGTGTIALNAFTPTGVQS